jgi:hypothetical protein
VKVGDLVRLIKENELGIVININMNETDDALDMMFPYHVHFLTGNYRNDWFGARSLESINESR